MEASLENYAWKPSDAQALGDEECSAYSRLRKCPAVLGSLDPVLCVRFGSEEEWLRAADFGSASALAARMSEVARVPLERIELHQTGTKLGKDAVVEWGVPVDVMELALLRVRVVTSCCCSPLEGAHVVIKEQKHHVHPSGSTDHIAVAPGRVEVRLVHVATFLSETIIVSPGANEHTFAAATQFLVYITDPEVDEEEESVAFDPSFVWLGADPGHVPDDALVAHGQVCCRNFGVEDVAVALEASEMAPVVFNLGAEPSTWDNRPCMLTSLRLTCHRRGFVWSPKKPSPLEERAEAIGGCEFLRILACPVSLGFLKRVDGVSTGDMPSTPNTPMKGASGSSHMYALMQREPEILHKPCSLPEDDPHAHMAAKPDTGLELPEHAQPHLPGRRSQSSTSGTDASGAGPEWQNKHEASDHAETQLEV